MFLSQCIDITHALGGLPRDGSDQVRLADVSTCLSYSLLVNVQENVGASVWGRCRAVASPVRVKDLCAVLCCLSVKPGRVG